MSYVYADGVNNSQLHSEKDSANTRDSSSENAAPQAGVIEFKKVVADAQRKQYLLGEVDNVDSNASIFSSIYFGKDINSAYYIEEIGTVAPRMGMPFKIPLNDSNIQFNVSDIHAQSAPTSLAPNRGLQVDYDSLVFSNSTHSIAGLLVNKSPYDASNIRVFALALDNNSTVLDVVQSDVIASISSNQSAKFTLEPMQSIAAKVSHYSCFVPGESGMNVTLPAENGSTLQLAIGGDGKIRNIKYDHLTHIISLDAQGVFLGGGTVTLMITEGPDSLMKSNLAITLNGKNATKFLISSVPAAPGKYYRHIEIPFSFGKNSITIAPQTVVPEFQFVLIPLAASLSVVFLALRLGLKRE